MSHANAQFASFTTRDGRRVEFARRNPASFTATHDGNEIGRLDAYDAEGIRAMVHTEVDDRFQGLGVASALVNYAVRQTRAEGLRIAPQCSYVRMWLQRHPEFVTTDTPSTTSGDNEASDRSKGAQ